MNSQIIPECYADTLLVEMLGFLRPNHQLGIGKVLGLFDKTLKNRPAVGIIDDDKVKPKSLGTFELVEENFGIKRFRKEKHFVLVISPAFEDWIYDNAEAKEVDPANYGFSDRKRFRDACKKVDAGKNPNLKNFLNTLKQKKAPGFEQLTDWICEGAGIDREDLP